MKHIETKPPRHRLPVVITTSEWESTPSGREGDGVGLGVQLAPVGGGGWRSDGPPQQEGCVHPGCAPSVLQGIGTVWRIPWLPQTSPFDSRRFGN